MTAPPNWYFFFLGHTLSRLVSVELQLFIIRGLIKINGLLSVIAIILCDLTLPANKDLVQGTGGSGGGG